MSTTHPSVAHVSWAGDMGGIQRLVHDLAVEQVRLGMDVTVAFGQAKGLFADRLRARGVRVLDLELRSGYDVRPHTLSRGAEVLRKSQVVHAHGPINVPLSAIAGRSGRPIVFTHHGLILTHRGDSAKGHRRGIRGIVSRRTESRFIRVHCAAVVANSNWTAERICEIYGAHRAEIAVVHNGIATCAPSINRAGNSTLTVVFVGRLVRFKRVDRLIHAVERLGSDHDVRVLIAGRGPLEHDLRTLVRDLGVDDQVHFLGWQEDMDALWREADILVMPSAGEPFGLAMIEAAAQGLVTVAFADGGGVLETVGPDGRVVQSVRELSETLRDLRGSSTLSQKARLARSAWAREKFAINSTAVRYLELYKTASAEM